MSSGREPVVDWPAVVWRREPGGSAVRPDGETRSTRWSVGDLTGAAWRGPADWARRATAASSSVDPALPSSHSGIRDVEREMRMRPRAADFVRAIGTWRCARPGSSVLVIAWSPMRSPDRSRDQSKSARASCGQQKFGLSGSNNVEAVPLPPAAWWPVAVARRRGFACRGVTFAGVRFGGAPSRLATLFGSGGASGRTSGARTTGTALWRSEPRP
jgi:hypothetical protein